MNKLITFIAIVFTTMSFGQQMMSCEKGTARAKQDFKNKMYTLQTLGQSVDKDFDPILIGYAKRKYDIKLTSAPCVIWPEPECYDKTMRSKVLKKFGEDIEPKIKAEALEIFKKTDKYLSEIKPKIDTGLVVSYHTDAEYPGNETGWRAFVCNNIQATPKSFWTSYVTFVVEKDGTFSQLTFDNETLPEAKTEVERLFALMEKWMPATYYGEKVRVQKTISIHSKKSTEMMDEARIKRNLEPKPKPKPKTIKKRNSAK